MISAKTTNYTHLKVNITSESIPSFFRFYVKHREGNIFLSKPYPLSPRFGIYTTSTPPVAGLQNN